MSCKINEITGDLFSCPSNVSMAHCVAEDLRMGKGIAVKFRNLFGQVNTLKNQNIKTGGVAVLNDKSKRFIYYLITKKSSYGKPTYRDLSESIIAMKDHMVKNNIKQLAIPRLGCGLDGLAWTKVKDLLIENFKNETVEITIYNFPSK